MDGTNIEDLVTTGLMDPLDIALDLTAGKMYWTDQGTDKIQRANLDGTNIQDLVTTGLENLDRLALDLEGNRMYWTDAGAGRVQRANLDGSNVETLVAGLGEPRGIELDLAAGTMYWTDNFTDRIQSADLDGSNIQDYPRRRHRPDRSNYDSPWNSGARTNRCHRAPSQSLADKLTGRVSRQA